MWVDGNGRSEVREKLARVPMVGLSLLPERGPFSDFRFDILKTSFSQSCKRWNIPVYEYVWLGEIFQLFVECYVYAIS